MHSFLHLFSWAKLKTAEHIVGVVATDSAPIVSFFNPLAGALDAKFGQIMLAAEEAIPAPQSGPAKKVSVTSTMQTYLQGMEAVFEALGKPIKIDSAQLSAAVDAHTTYLNFISSLEKQISAATVVPPVAQ